MTPAKARPRTALRPPHAAPKEEGIGGYEVEDAPDSPGVEDE